MLKTIFTNTCYVIWIAILSGAVSICLSFVGADWTRFARSGSLICLLGGVLATRRVIRLGVKKALHKEQVQDYGGFERSKADMEEDKQEGLDIEAIQKSFYVIAIGTIIWGFGDLVGNILNKRAED
jgi:hypothetical protein